MSRSPELAHVAVATLRTARTSKAPRRVRVSAKAPFRGDCPQGLAPQEPHLVTGRGSRQLRERRRGMIRSPESARMALASLRTPHTSKAPRRDAPGKGIGPGQGLGERGGQEPGCVIGVTRPGSARTRVTGKRSEGGAGPRKGVAVTIVKGRVLDSDIDGVEPSPKVHQGHRRRGVGRGHTAVAQRGGGEEERVHVTAVPAGSGEEELHGIGVAQAGRAGDEVEPFGANGSRDGRGEEAEHGVDIA
jgi:hypothetical protein